VIVAGLVPPPGVTEATRPRVLLAGCHGRLGQHLLRVLLPEARVLGLGVEERSFVSHPSFRYHPLEGVSRRELKPLFLDFRPHAAINAAAWTDVDGAETKREACWRTNVELTRALVECCRPHGVWLGQVSTDFVFNGRGGPYRPDDAPGATGVYAQSKLAAENLVRGAAIPAAIFRTIVLFGKGHGLKPDFFEWTLGELRGGRPIRVVTDQVGNCCWALDLARAMDAALRMRRTGIFHVAARGRMSRHAMALLLARLEGLDASLVRPLTTAELGQAAPRPREGGLVVEETERALGLRFPAIEQALRGWLRDQPQMWSIN
jgi:dTDP-4-dehydrorhamnose reductase